MTEKIKSLLYTVFPGRDKPGPTLDMRLRIACALGAMVLCFAGGLFTETLTVAADDFVTKLIISFMAGWLVFRAGYYFANRSFLSLLALAVLLCLGFWIRMSALNAVTLDYANFLQPWTEQFRDKGWAAFKDEFSNYNMPYLYMLAIIARLPIHDLYLIKLCSILFDCAMVLAALRLAGHFNFSPLRLTLLGTAVFVAPTVWLNSAYWGQCDVVYAFFVVMAFIYILEKRPSLSFVMAALAFSLKLQAVFFLPCYLIYWMTKRVRFGQFFLFPLVYILSVLPAWFLGKPWSQILGVYLEQAKTGSYTLNFNSPSVFALIWINEDNPRFDFFAYAGIVCAFLLVAVLCYMAWERRKTLNDKALAIITLAMVLGIPWFLPRMHERYFFIADMFFIFAAFLFPKCWYFAPIGIFCSFAGYHAYIFERYIPYIGVVVPALMLMLMLGRVLILFWQSSAKTEALPPVGQKAGKAR